jgi:prepilin-type N-terminal cleavage/methylation domain-containing protein
MIKLLLTPSNNGWTLIELMVVAMIAGVMAAIAFQFFGYLESFMLDSCHILKNEDKPVRGLSVRSGSRRWCAPARVYLFARQRRDRASPPP